MPIHSWIYATMFGAESVFGIAVRASGLYGTHISLAFFVSILVYGICLLAAAATDQKLLSLYVSKKTLFVSAALMCVGCLILLAPPLGNEAVTTTLEIISGIATGIGSAMLIVFWGVAFARCDAASIVLNTAVAIVVGFGLYTFVLRELPFPFAGILTSLIPLGELYILRKKTPQPYFERGEIPIFNPLPVRKASFVARFGVPVFVFGLALGTLRQTSIQSRAAKRRSCSSLRRVTILPIFRKSSTFPKAPRKHISAISTASSTCTHSKSSCAWWKAWKCRNDSRSMSAPASSRACFSALGRERKTRRGWMRNRGYRSS